MRIRVEALLNAHTENLRIFIVDEARCVGPLPTRDPHRQWAAMNKSPIEELGHGDRQSDEE